VSRFGYSRVVVDYIRSQIRRPCTTHESRCRCGLDKKTRRSRVSRKIASRRHPRGNDDDDDDIDDDDDGDDDDDVDDNDDDDRRPRQWRDDLGETLSMITQPASPSNNSRSPIHGNF